MVPRVLRRLRLAARYVALRRHIARAYDERALDDLLRALDRAAPREIAIADASAAIVLGERIARRARLDPDTCLYRALARYALLHRAGHAPRFVMGIDEHDPASGHAWVELDGAPFLERPLPPYRRTLQHPAGA